MATGAFVSILLPGSLVGPFTLVYRLLLVYLPAAVGAFVLLSELGPGRRRAPAPTLRAPEPVASPRWSWPGRVPLGIAAVVRGLFGMH